MRSEHPSTDALETLRTQVQSVSRGRLLSGVRSPAETPHVEQDELRDYVYRVLGRKWLILAIVTIVTTIVALYVFSLPSMYESEVTLQLQPKEYSYMEDSKGTILHSYTDYDYTNTQIQLLSNPQLMREVVLKLDLEHNPAVLNASGNTGFFSRIRGFLTRRKIAPPQPASTPLAVDTENNANALTPARITQLEPYVIALLANLKVEPQARTNLVKVSLTHPRPEIAMQVVDTLTKSFVANNARYEMKGSQAASETLGRQLADLQTKITRMEDEKLSYLVSHNLPLEKGDGRNLTAERLGMLSSQLLQAESDRKNLEATYGSAKTATDPMSIPEVRDTPEMQDMRRVIHELEQKRASLMQVYTAEWPEVKKVEAEIKQIQKNINKSVKETVDSLKSRLDTAVAREAKLRAAYYAEWGAANSQTRNEVSIANLNQQIDTSRTLYNAILQRQKEKEIDDLDKSNSVAIVTPASVPTHPIATDSYTKVVIAFLISLIAGVLLAVTLDQLDSTMRSAKDVATHINLPTLALIPSGAGFGRFSLRKLMWFNGNGAEGTALDLTSDPRSPTAEAYRHLRASLLYPSSGHAPQTIVVTSGGPFEGKTTTTINIAVTLAQSGAEVLIIDGDLRRPQLHHHFDISGSDGLTSYLLGEESFDSLLQTSEDFPNLKLITAGSPAANPAAVLGSLEMHDLLEVLERHFTHIIIDSPPASSFADASLLSMLADGVIIVVHSKRSSRRVVRRVKERLENLGASVYGVVLNHVDLRSDEYYSEYYRSYE